jgi:RimJ/RimL family protein N-acetyltransferase
MLEIAQPAHAAAEDTLSSWDRATDPEEPQLLTNIRGDMVALGPFVKEHQPIYHRWLSDFDTLRRTGIPIKPSSAEQMPGVVERIQTTEGRIWFVVYELGTGRPVGFAGISHVDYVNRTAEFNICIGERTARGKGYGTEATGLVLDYAFTALGLHSVYLLTSESNIAGQRAYAKAGFREFGRRRQCLMQGGRLWDTVHMECLAHEFRSPVLARVFGMEC